MMTRPTDPRGANMLPFEDSDIWAVAHARIEHEAPKKCYQRELRERNAALSPRIQMDRFVNPRVIEIPSDMAKPIIYKYEWLGTMGRSVHCVGLFEGWELMGVACFGWPGSPESRDICGREFREKAIALERGACVHYAPRNAGSYLVSHATKLISLKHGYNIFYAYSDESAGEVGTIYQACNWLYIGQGVGRTPGRMREYYKTPEGKILSSRSLRHKNMTKKDAIKEGWQVLYQTAKHKYVYFEGSKATKRDLLKRLRYPVLPYPKRYAQEVQRED